MKLNEAVSFVQDTDILSSGKQSELRESTMYVSQYYQQVSPYANTEDISTGRWEMRDYNITMLKKSGDVERYMSKLVNDFNSGENVSKHKRKIRKLGKAINRASKDAEKNFSQEASRYMGFLDELHERAAMVVGLSLEGVTKDDPITQAAKDRVEELRPDISV